MTTATLPRQSFAERNRHALTDSIEARFCLRIAGDPDGLCADTNGPRNTIRYTRETARSGSAVALADLVADAIDLMPERHGIDRAGIVRVRVRVEIAYEADTDDVWDLDPPYRRLPVKWHPVITDSEVTGAINGQRIPDGLAGLVCDVIDVDWFDLEPKGEMN